MLTHKKLLLVDDEFPQLTELSIYFLRRGWQVDTAQTEAEAARRLTILPYDALICEVNLQKSMECGLRVIRAARGQNPRCCIIALSGMPGGQFENSVLQAGANAYLPKPSALAKIANTLEGTRCTVNKAPDNLVQQCSGSRS